MAVEIRDFTVTIPAGTPQSAGFTSDMSFPARIVTQINVRVPPGPRGEVGFKVGSGGVQILPAPGGDFIVTDNEDLIYPLTDTITSGAWQLLAYNTGSYPHTLRVYFFCDLVTGGSATDTGTGGISVIGTTGSTGDDGGDGGGGTVTVPPVTPPVTVTPPVVTPPSTGAPNPVLLPPTVNIPPSLGGPELPGDPDEVLIGIADLTEVWLLSEESYTQIATQDAVNALSAAGIQGVAVSTDMHNQLLASTQADLTLVIGPETLDGWWQTILTGGVPPHRV